MDSHTKKSQRIIILVIAIIMAAGFVGSYFLIIINQNVDSSGSNSSQNSTQNEPVDPTAYKVKGKVTQLQVTDLTVGTGPAVKAGDTVRVHYKGTIAQTGVKFDSSYDRGEPVTLKLQSASAGGSDGGVIDGWVQGIPGMQVGGKRRLVIPASLAYGSQGTSGVPANSDLVFEVELLAINPQ